MTQTVLVKRTVRMPCLVVVHETVLLNTEKEKIIIKILTEEENENENICYR